MVSAKSPILRLEHILYEIAGIRSETEGVSTETIATQYGLIRLTERGLQIISEAAKELPEDIRAMEPEIPWKKIIGIGNLLRHEYYRISTSDIQTILEFHLPVLELAAQRILERLKA